ncbi:MAG: Gfo/Idh/MocA family protein [Chitinophagales bacterium]
MKKIRFAVVGCGQIGGRHAQLSAVTGDLMAVCDIDREKAIQTGNKYGVKHFFRIEDLLKEEKNIDLMVICTPNGLHASHSVQSLEAGLHVLCEKPISITVSEGQRMIEVAKISGKELFIVKQNRFNPPVLAVKKLLDEGKLGKISAVQVNGFWYRGDDYYQDSLWRGTLSLDGGILFTQFSHFIDLLYWFMGDIKNIHAFGSNFSHQDTIEFEDGAVVCLEFHNGAIGTAHFTINSYRKNMEGSLTIFGENGTVKIGGQYLNAIEYEMVRDLEIGNVPAGNKSNDYGTYQGSMSNHDKIYQHVRDVLTMGAPNQFSGQDALKTVEIIERIYAAAGRHQVA